MIKIAIYGAGLTGLIARLWLEAHGYTCLFFIDDVKSETLNEVEGLKILSLSSALSVCKKHNIQIFIANTNGWRKMKQNLDHSGFLNYKIFYYSTYMITDNPSENDRSELLDEKISSVESYFKDSYSQLLFKNIVNKKRKKIPYFINLHNQYFVHYIPQKDDVIFDCGAGIGDFILKALTYAPDAEIYAFEPDPVQFGNLSHQFKNHQNVNPINAGVYNCTKQTFFTDDLGRGANMINETGDVLIDVTSIDFFFKKNELHKIDFIKMDIEGAELNAITGAEQTIKKYKPSLAISLYHKTEDLWTIPLAIKKIRQDYNFFLEHHSIGMGETVLYAV